jgi:coronin-1B/1C/6
VTSCKDKKIRILDPRSGTVASEGEAHTGIKGSRAIWLGSKDKIFSCGFTKTSERETCVWDPKDMSKPLIRQSVDSASGLLMPFYDNDLSLLFVAGKGDGNIRYYEVVDEAPYIHYLTEFKSNSPQRGMCMVPKRVMNVSDCEIVRLLKVGVKIVEPISMNVPRKSDIFQDDIYPDCNSGEPALTSDEWQKGKNAVPKTRSMAPGFVVKAKVVEFNPEKVVEKPLTERELKDEVEKLTKRVSYLEAELIKKDAKLKEMGH